MSTKISISVLTGFAANRSRTRSISRRRIAISAAWPHLDPRCETRSIGFMITALLDDGGTPLMTWTPRDHAADAKLRRCSSYYDRAMSLAATAAAVEADETASDLAIERANRKARAAWNALTARTRLADARRRARVATRTVRALRRSRSSRRQRCVARRRVTRTSTSGDGEPPAAARARCQDRHDAAGAFVSETAS